MHAVQREIRFSPVHHGSRARCSDYHEQRVEWGAFRRGECTRRDESNTVIPSCPDMGVFEDLTERIVSVKSGSAAVLTLPPIESHPAPDVTWFTSDGSLLYGIKYASVHHTLLILNASEGDQGLYRFVFETIDPQTPEFLDQRFHCESSIQTKVYVTVAPIDIQLV